MKWATQQLATLIGRHHGRVLIVLDPDELLHDVAIDNVSVAIVDSWWPLRAAYELSGRRRRADAPTLVLVVHPPLTSEDLPWDIQQDSDVVATIRLPGPAQIRDAIRSLDDDEFDRAIEAVKSNAANPAGALLHAVTGVPLGAAPLGIADQIRLAAQIASRSTASSGLATLGKRWVTDSRIVGLLDSPPDPSGLQLLWDSFVSDPDQDVSEPLRRAALELAPLFATGVLESRVASRPLDSWALIGVRDASDEDRAQQLLDAAPDVAMSTGLVDWHNVAVWWGDLRRLSAPGPTQLREAAWSTWDQIDATFVPWLRANYGTLLTSSAPWPAAVHRVGPFLARRIRDGLTERVMLIVLDGLGYAQWAHLCERLQFEIAEAGSTLAMVPTYTTVSRQAIFAGELPLSFPDTLWTTQPEPRHWQTMWGAEGIPVTRVKYHKRQGRLPQDRLGFDDAQVIGVVVNAVDDLMHSSKFLGDAQLLANLDVWAANGFLTDLIGRANAAGFETWITSDHGNIECVGTGTVSEGLAIEAAGKRLLRYANATLRDVSDADGTIWDSIPGLPSTAEPLMFAKGRAAFTKDHVGISHGGLSIDEVIVPLARVLA